MKNILSITDLTKKDIKEILLLSQKLKKEYKEKGENEKILKGKSVVSIYEKPSLRTRLSFDIAIAQLGGTNIFLDGKQIGFGVREPLSDMAKVVSSMADMLIARVITHKSLKEFAKHSAIPVINALSDIEHPCQILADLLTIKEIKGSVSGLKIAFIGDCENNIVHSYALACAILGVNFHCASPLGYEIKEDIYKEAVSRAKGSFIKMTNDPKEAVVDADVVVTDTWVSMGDESEATKREKIFASYQVTTKLMSYAKKDAIFLHCMPIYRECEVITEVADGPNSAMFLAAENRLHAQKGLLAYLSTIK